MKFTLESKRHEYPEWDVRDQAKLLGNQMKHYLATVRITNTNSERIESKKAVTSMLQSCL